MWPYMWSRNKFIVWEMNTINKATRQYILKHAHDDVRQLALRGEKDPQVNLPFALQQIAGRQKALAKLPSWAAVEGIVYPPHLSMEQCSSELTARYKAEVAGCGDSFVDLTAGFGVDAAFIAQGFQKAVCVELQPELCAISSENFKLLGLHQIEVVNGNGLDYLHTMPHADLLFIDPARRDEHGGRTYGIADCTPNVLDNLDEMMEKADRVLIKLSPMLDWRKAIEDLGQQHVSTVYIVSVDNECKELLIEVRSEKCKVKSAEPSLRVVCVNLLSDGTSQDFEYDPSSSVVAEHLSYTTPRFLYEPNASLMKAGCFDLLASRYGVEQADVNSHLFLSDGRVESFPGRGFIIDRVTSMNKRDLKEALSGITHANIAVRNFPMSAVELRRRLKLRDGGDTFIFATTVANQGHLLFVCRKIS